MRDDYILQQDLLLEFIDARDDLQIAKQRYRKLRIEILRLHVDRLEVPGRYSAKVVEQQREIIVNIPGLKERFGADAVEPFIKRWTRKDIRARKI
jgi:hypothetical protein